MGEAGGGGGGGRVVEIWERELGYLSSDPDWVKRPPSALNGVTL